MGVYSLWYVLWLERWRARVPEVIDPIIFGGLSLLLGLLCLAALPAARSGPMRLLFGAGACAGLLASALSGTRGAWIALPVGLVVLDRCQWQYLGARWRWSALAGVLAIVVALVAWPDTHVRDRIGDAYTAIARTLTEDGGGGSGFWFRPTLYATVTGEIIPASPWVGHGPVALRDELRPLAEQPGASSNLKRLADRPEATQTHNDVLQSLVWGGALGVAVLSVVYLWPLAFFLRALRRTSHRLNRALATMGILVPCLYGVFGLSYSYFAFPISALSYIALVMLAAWTLRAQSSLISAGSSPNATML